MNKTAFILTLFSLATEVSFAAEKEESPTKVSDISDNMDAQGKEEEQKEEKIASADDEDREEHKSSSVKTDLGDDSAEEENAEPKAGGTGPEKEDEKKDLDLPKTEVEAPGKKESNVEHKPVRKKKHKPVRKKNPVRKKKNSRKIKHARRCPTTNHAAIQAERNQNGMQPQGCPASADSEAVAVVSDDTCTTS